MSGPRPAAVSRECDLAIRLLMVTLAQHRRGEDALSARPTIGGRLRVLPPDTVSSRIRRESVLVRSVSIMEAYVHGQLVDRLAALAPSPRTDLVETLYAQFEEKGITSWEETANYFKKYVDSSVAIRTYGSWNQVDAVIQARIAVVHGLGYFTKRQVRRGIPSRVATHLTKLKFRVPVDHIRVYVTAEALEASTSLLRSYLEWMDTRLAAAP